MKKLLEKILTASDKTVVAVVTTFTTLVTAWTLAMVDEITFDVVAMVIINAWLIIDAVTFDEEEE